MNHPARAGADSVAVVKWGLWRVTRDANGALYYELVCLPCESILLSFQLSRDPA
jgi:hypothetical protein